MYAMAILSQPSGLNAVRKIKTKQLIEKREAANESYSWK